MFEEEFDKVQRVLFPGISGMSTFFLPFCMALCIPLNSTDTIAELDYFTLLSTLQDIQVFYFMPVSDFSAEIFKRNVLKAYGTAQLVIRQALKLQEETGFLYYAPHFVCRTLLASACITMNVLLSPYMKDMPIQTKSSIMQDVILSIRTCSVHESDLPSRTSKIIESYWSVDHLKPPRDIPMKDVSQFSSRLGTSFAFDYIRRWKRDVEASLSNVASITMKRQPSGAPGTFKRLFSFIAVSLTMQSCFSRSISSTARKCTAH